MKKILVGLLLGITIIGGVGCTTKDVKTNDINTKETRKIEDLSLEEQEELLNEMEEEGLLDNKYVEKKKQELGIEEKEEKTTKKSTKKQQKALKSNQIVTEKPGEKVWVTGSGTKYHTHNHCGRTSKRNARLVSLKEAQIRCTPCKKCF